MKLVICVQCPAQLLLSVAHAVCAVVATLRVVRDAVAGSRLVLTDVTKYVFVVVLIRAWIDDAAQCLFHAGA